MCLLGYLDSFEIGELEALAQRRNDGSRQRGTVLMKPESGHLYAVGRCVDFFNLFRAAFLEVGQATGLIFKVARTTSLSAIFSNRLLMLDFRSSGARRLSSSDHCKRCLRIRAQCLARP